MAFVSCGQFKTSQEEQDKAIQKLKEELEKKAISAEDELLDKSSSVGGGKVTVEKIKQAVAGDVEVSVTPRSGIIGNGTKASPLELKFGEDFALDNSGNLILNSVSPKSLGVSLSTTNYKLGFHTFSGYVDKGRQTGTLGLPVNFDSLEPEEEMAETFAAYADGTFYDYNGYYIASSHEIGIWVQNGNAMWYISNDSGVNTDGSLKDPTAWTKWQKLDNAGAVTNEMIKSMQNQINALQQNLKSANDEISELQRKNEEPCKVPVKHLPAGSTYTLQNSDNTLVIESGDIIIPDNIMSGRVFTIIQSGVGPVNLSSSGDVGLHAPFEGSLTLAGERAIVSVIYEMRNANGTQHVQVAGQVETA